MASTYTMAQLKNLWIQAGGAATAATMAAAIAMAESGGDPNASNTNGNGTTDRGLWQINSIHGSQSTFDPLANAKSAVAISQNGTTWRPWCTAWSTGLCSGTYLGSGSPVFKFLNGASVGTTDSIGVSTPALDISNPLNPQTWVNAFLAPIGTWFFYGGAVSIGIVLIGVGLMLIVKQSQTWRTLAGLTTSIATRGAIQPGTGTNQGTRAAEQGVNIINKRRKEKTNKKGTQDEEKSS